MRYTEILGEYWEILRDRLTVPLRLGTIGGVRKTERLCVIYKCNKYPERYLREAPPPKIYLTLFALPFIMRIKGDEYDRKRV